jgi:hypothetical protein
MQTHKLSLDEEVGNLNPNKFQKQEKGTNH